MNLNRSFIPGGSAIICVLFLFIVSSCSLHRIKHTPNPKEYNVIEGKVYNNGLPKQRQPWVVYSDRADNSINIDKKDVPYINYKKGEFLQPLVVLRKRKGMFKVAEYESKLVNNNTILKIEKNLKVLGWVPEERLLLWSNGLKDAANGFTLKATITVNDSEIIKNAEKYLEGNAAILYATPALKTKTDTRIDIGSFVYIYKQSADKNFYLIGGKPGSKSEDIKENIYGWVSSHLVSTWGERSSFKIVKDSVADNKIQINTINNDSLTPITTLNSEDLAQREGITGIYSLQSINDGVKEIKYFDNIFDYNKNTIYNVLGNPITYAKYKDILRANKRLNVVFALDVGNSNASFLPVTKSLVQELSFSFKDLPYFSSIKYGGVVYKENDCGATSLQTPLSNDFNAIAQFFEKQIDTLDCKDNSVIQPVDKGLAGVTELLSDAKEDTNIVIVIGATASVRNQVNEVTEALTKVNAKPIFFQTHSKSRNSYNDFVLLAQQAVARSAKEIVEAKKEKIVSQHDLLLNTNYNVTAGKDGIYSLNYPEESMTQGYVIFPNRDESTRPVELRTVVDSLLVEVTRDNIQIDSNLTKYFLDFGGKHTYVSKEYQDLYPLKERLVPATIASSLLNQDNSFLINGYILNEKDVLASTKNEAYGVLLNEQEYEQLSSLYGTIAQRIFASKLKFKKNRSLRKYLRVVSKFSPTLRKKKMRELKKMSMEEIVAVSTGFPVISDSLMKETPKDWMKNEKIKEEDILTFFLEYRNLAEELVGYKVDDAVKFMHNDQVFYWLPKEFFPSLEINDRLEM